MGTSIAAKQNPLARRENVAQSSYKLPPLPSSSLEGGLPAEVAMKADDESELSSEDVPGSGGVPSKPCSRGGGLYPGTCHLTSQMLGFRFADSLFLVHAEE